MKKIILVILSVLCLVSYGQLEKKSEKKNDLTEENLKGKVKSIKETTYKAVDKFGQIEKGDVLVDSSAVYTDDGRFKIYNEKGNKIEENYYNSNSSLIYKNTYKYDEKGNKIEENYYNSNGRLYSKTTYKYDEKGNIIEENHYDSNGRLDSKYTYEYDKNNNWTQRIEYKNTIPHRITERIIEYYP